ncbi:MAG: hypothetical protein EAZ70_03985 [Runella slithyformis]|nr:MAG: hypothetical protein EAY79_01905 [Runella slithyformis]TAF95458.1 MAG: hypothetical protein EAZ46_07760 [Runella sp.]TAG21151.1 MAG: hypothetical protein EAZ38_08685 [Cytophagales bacterium]TAG40263.1 MAG: hypothetical protein EAZ32_07155 [Cytophagia bacterium]TAE99937.1 MAG: hypothetical protein EAZ80_04345 [Runella slithyformis]
MPQQSNLVQQNYANSWPSQKNLFFTLPTNQKHARNITSKSAARTWKNNVYYFKNQFNHAFNKMS